MLKEEFQAEALTFRDHLEVIEAFHERRWTDGLPVIPPTPDLVAAMVAGAGRSAREVVAVVPPRWAEATVENVAINAVMAGCKPEYMPVLLAAVEAACDPVFSLYSVQATTHPCAVLMVVTGPVVKEIKLNCEHGIFGPGHRANASLGRAMRLILLNVGGGLPGHGDQSTQGSPGKYSYCIAENEAATPWEPYRVMLGYGREDSTVTVFAGESPHNCHDRVCATPHSPLRVAASAMSTFAHNNSNAVKVGDILWVVCPEHAKVMARGGLTPADLRQYLFEHARNTRARMTDWGPHRMENWPLWVSRDDPRARVPIVGRPEDIHIVVAGGPGKHSAFIPTFGFQKSVTRKVQTVT